MEFAQFIGGVWVVVLRTVIVGAYICWGLEFTLLLGFCGGLLELGADLGVLYCVIAGVVLVNAYFVLFGWVCFAVACGVLFVLFRGLLWLTF